jgi:hypothetical protein
MFDDNNLPKFLIVLLGSKLLNWKANKSEIVCQSVDPANHRSGAGNKTQWLVKEEIIDGISYVGLRRGRKPFFFLGPF